MSAPPLHLRSTSKKQVERKSREVLHLSAPPSPPPYKGGA